MKIIDFHTHPTWFNTSTRKIGVDPSLESFIEVMKLSGITMFCGSAIDVELINSGKDYLSVIRALNERIFAAAEKYPDVIVPGIHVHSEYVSGSIEEIEKYSKKGLRLVGELVPYMLGGKRLEDPRAFGAASYLEPGFLEIFKVCEEKGLLLSIHTSTPEEGRELAKRFKNLNIVMAHAGPVDSFIERVAAVKAHDNLYFDISGSGTFAQGVVEYAYKELGKEKILFGSDYPGYPPSAFVGIVSCADIPDEAKEYIFYKNAERLLGF